MQATTNETWNSGKPTSRFKQRLLRVDAVDEVPLSLRHERIYILPTPRGMGFVAVAMVMIIASMNYGLNLGYALSFIFIGLFASCLLATYQNLAGLTIQSINSADAFANTTVEYHVMVADSKGRSRYSISLSARQSSSQKPASADSLAIIDVGAHQSAQAILRAKAQFRGEHKLGRVTVSSDFPLGLWRGWGYLHTPASAFIYPAPESPVKPFPSSTLLHSTKASNQTAAESREFQQLKRHQETDPLSSVAWKTVARGGGWYSKEFTTPAVARDIELNWNSTAKLPGAEQRLSRLCAWIIQADVSGIPYGLRLDHMSTGIKHGVEHKRNCLRQLATFKQGH